MTYLLGLDLGQAADYTALAAIERSGSALASYAARHLQRWPLRTPYPSIVTDVSTMLGRPPLRGATLLVDATGVGAAVVDLFRGASLDGELVAVTITAGGEAQRHEHDRGAWRAPKRDLVGCVQVLLQAGRFKVAAALPEAETLVRELEAFRVRISAAGNDTWRGEGSKHDDLVLAVALACWWGETQGGAGILGMLPDGTVIDSTGERHKPKDWTLPGVWPD